jgi:ABC-2 type transport system ATP-binding protein
MSGAGDGPLIRVDRLVKEFRRPVRKTGAFAGLRSLLTLQRVTTRAVDEVSFTIDPGEIVGYLGPNGAGKSTTIKMLTGVLVPTSGEVSVGGVVPWRDRTANARNIGVVFGQRSQLWMDLPLRDSFDIIRRLYGIPDADYARALGGFRELLGLDDFIDQPVRTLSLGQRMRGDLTAAMLYEPPLLYLDEPTVGLDVVAKARIRDFVDETNRTRGTTVMLTTHDLDDVERLCRRVLLIDHGRVLFDGDIATLRRRYVPHRDLVVTLAGDGAVHDVGGARLHALVHDESGRVATFRFDPAAAPTPAVVQAVTAAYDVTDLSVVDPDLEGVIAEIYGAGAVRADAGDDPQSAPASDGPGTLPGPGAGR